MKNKLVKTATEIKNISIASKVVAQILATLFQLIVPGNNGLILATKAKKIIQENQCQPNFLNYQGFPNVICISINNQLIHGIPNDYSFQNGDLISIDVGCQYQGFHADAALTKIVGVGTKEDQKLLLTTKTILNDVIQILKPGVTLGDVGFMINNSARVAGYYVTPDYAGHGIGRSLHEVPEILNFGKPHTGFKLLAGMTICIEPMLLLQSSQTKVLSDGWTVASENGKNNCHFEHTILITNDGCQVLTEYESLLPKLS